MFLGKLMFENNIIILLKHYIENIFLNANFRNKNIPKDIFKHYFTLEMFLKRLVFYFRFLGL